MEGYRKNDSANNALTKNHFAKFHQRVHNKYVEMQKKLHKSRSVDSLTYLNDDFVLKPSTNFSTIDLSEAGKVFTEIKSDYKPVKFDVIVEDVNKQNVTILDHNADRVSELEVTEAKEKDEKNIFFGDDVSSSCESSFEEIGEDKTNDESLPHTPLLPPSPSPSPHPKISIRDKIGTRITAVKERRREMRDKREEKKRESLETLEKKQLILINTSKLKKMDSTKKKQKVASVTVALIEATGLENEALSDEKSRSFYCRIRLGSEKRKSTKTAKSTGNVIHLQEMFHLNLFDDYLLEISLFDKDSTIGKAVVDLSSVEREKTHRMRLNLEEESGNVQIFILLTISGATLVNTFVDLGDYEGSQRNFEMLDRKYSLFSLCQNMSDVGWASVIVYGAKGLSSSDTYCVLELDNDRRQTHTEYKTHDPNWMKIMEFDIKDITSILVVTIFDERKAESVGRICIPLLKVENGIKKWYALKDNNNKDRAKGNNPRILIEMTIFYNSIKASLRVISPKEENFLKTDQEFSRHVFAHNYARAKAVIQWTLEAFRVLKACFEWESRRSNTIALTIWIVFWWVYEAWMLPLLLLIPFILYSPQYYRLIKRDIALVADEADDKEEKNKSLIKKLNTLQDLIQTVQNGIGKLADFGESIKNLCNFTVPFLSCLAIFVILLISIVMYLVPVQYLFIAWGIHKFLRKIIRPNRIPNNELLDLLSRVPDDETLHACEELPLLALAEEDKID